MSKPLKLNGKPFDLHPPSPTLIKIQAFLDKSPSDELFTSCGLSKATNTALRSITYLNQEGVVDTYSLKHGPIRYWGHPRAIAALRLQLEAAQ